MGDEEANASFPDQAQRAAVCHSFWRHRNARHAEIGRDGGRPFIWTPHRVEWLDEDAENAARPATEIQTLIFPKDHWESGAAAATWARDHDFSGSVEETGDSYRVRQKAPGAFARGSFRTVCLTGADAPTSGDCRVKAVIGHPRSGNAEPAANAAEVTAALGETPQFATVAISVQAVPPIRTETFLGRTFRVVPAVLVRSQVLRNNLGRTYLPAAEFTAEWAEVWNGIPVLYGPHPSLRGQPTTGRAPGEWNTRAVGWVFGAHISPCPDDGAPRLRAEVWLDESRAQAVDGFAAVLERVARGEPIELSTGFPTEVEEAPGEVHGKQYDLVMHPRGADHLVISTEMTGACSVADGCGLGVHFADVGDYEGEETGVDPHLVQRDTPTAVMPAQSHSGVQRLIGKVAELFRRRATPPAPPSPDDLTALALQREVDVWQELHPSDSERQQMIREALQKEYGGPGRECVVTDVFSDAGQAVFFYAGPQGPDPPGAEFYRCDFEETASGVEITSEPQLVRRMTTYEPVPGGGGGTGGNGGGQVQYSAPAVDPHEEEGDMDPKDMKALQDLTTAVQALTEQVTATNAKVTKLEQAAATDPNPSIAGLKRAIVGLTERLDKYETVAQTAITERERERQALVRELAGNYRVTFTQAELEAKPIDELRKIREMVTADNFAGRGGPQGGGAGADRKFMTPVKYWEKKPAEQEGK